MAPWRQDSLVMIAITQSRRQTWRDCGKPPERRHVLWFLASASPTTSQIAPIDNRRKAHFCGVLIQQNYAGVLIALPLIMGLMLGWPCPPRSVDPLSRLCFPPIAETDYLTPRPRMRPSVYCSLSTLFMPLAFAFLAISAGTMADRVFHEGLSSLDHPFNPAVIVIVATLILLSPR